MVNHTITWILAALLAALVACGDSSAPKPKKISSGADMLFSESDARVICDNTRCERLELVPSVGSLQGTVNQALNWQISATTSPLSSSRQLLIQASGGPATCNWSGAGASVSCYAQANAAGSGQVTVDMLDVSYCRFLMNSQRSNPNICQSIESAQNANLVVQKQVSWNVTEEQSNGFFGGQQALPPVQDQSGLLCFMGALNPLLGALGGGNILGAAGPAVQGCLNGFMQGQQMMNSQQQMQQMLMYQNATGQNMMTNPLQQNQMNPLQPNQMNPSQPNQMNGQQYPGP